MTLRHLLTHTAGYEERVAGLIGGTGTVPDLRASLVTDPPAQVYEPGTTPAYSNYGNALAGYVVEAVSGQPFEEYVAEHVLAPAGMTVVVVRAAAARRPGRARRAGVRRHRGRGAGRASRSSASRPRAR